jgi:hypothetical protein
MAVSVIRLGADRLEFAGNVESDFERVVKGNSACCSSDPRESCGARQRVFKWRNKAVQCWYMAVQVENRKQLISSLSSYSSEVECQPFTEVCFILSGLVIITDHTGTHSFPPGSGFILPKGLKYRWEMPETVVKFYVILEPPKAKL